MSLRRKDDWDEALEEVRAKQGEPMPETVVYTTPEQYGCSYIVTREQLFEEGE